METDLRTRLKAAHWLLPEDCRFPPASEEELSDFEAEFMPIPTDYRWYLKECGGGVVGSEWVDGIKQLRATHRKFQRESAAWGLKDVFVIGWDGWGNPFGIENPSGKVVAADHDFGGVHQMAPSIMGFLTAGLLK